MLYEDNIAIKLTSQQYECECYMRNSEESESVFIFESKQRTEDVRCPYCNGKVNICDLATKNLKDIPIWMGIAQELCFHCHRHRCIECGRSLLKIFHYGALERESRNGQQSGSDRFCVMV